VEMKKVSWPTKEQLRESTSVVIGVTIIITILIGLLDRVITWLLGLIFT
jgi:preprotein translocase SecE subunit